MAVKGGKARKGKYATYVKPYLTMVEQWCRDGMTEADIARKLGVSHNAWNDYKNKYPELVEAIRNGRASLVTTVYGTLLKRALGYDVVETKKTIAKIYDKDGKYIRDEVVQVVETTKHIPGELPALFALLRNYDKPSITGRDEPWTNFDHYSIENKREDRKNKKQELELKRKRLEAEIAEEVVLDE